MLFLEAQNLADLAVRKQGLVLAEFPAQRHVGEEALEDFRIRNIDGIRIVAGVEDLEAEPVLFEAAVDDLTEVARIDIAEDVSAALRRIGEEIREPVIFVRFDDVADPQGIDIEPRAALEGAGGLLVDHLGKTVAVHRVDVVILFQREVVEILKQAWTQDEINYEGQIYTFIGLTTDPVRPYQTGGPLLYFGGYSPDALDLCGQHCDVYLMWPEKVEELEGRMKAVNAVAEKYDRTLDYGLRVHMIVRDTEKEAQEYADYIVSKLDDTQGTAIRERALDARSLGVSHQAKNREIADEFGYIEPNLWTGVGRARSGCGAALVGSTDQVMSKIEAYQKMGIRAFIFSGYPHLEEAKHFGSRVLPNLKTCSLPHAYGRVPAQTPATPLGQGVRR